MYFLLLENTHSGLFALLSPFFHRAIPSRQISSLSMLTQTSGLQSSRVKHGPSYYLGVFYFFPELVFDKLNIECHFGVCFFLWLASDNIYTYVSFV